MHHSRLFCLLIIAALVCAAASSVNGQVMRLPPTDAIDEAGPFASPATYYAPAEITPPIETNPANPTEPAPPPAARPGVFQKAMLESDWLPQFGGNGLGMTDVLAKVVFALPCPTTASPLLITPSFGVHYLDRPTNFELPPELYDAFVEFRWLSHLTPQLGVDLAVTPGYYSDYQQQNSKAWRVTGHAITAWNWTPTASLVLGASYLDRTDVPVLPVCGVTWSPYDDLKMNLVFPEPKISHRVYWSGTSDPRIQDWVYLGGELDGGTWAVRRADGLDDTLYYRDWRVFLGIERKAIQALSSRLEIGYVFARKLQLDQAGTVFIPSTTLMLRGGLAY